MLENNNQFIAKEPMNEVLTTKVTATQKQEFGIEAQQQGIDASTYLRKLIEVRHATLNMLTFEGIVVPCSSEFEVQFQKMATEQGASIEQVAAWILRTFLLSYQQQSKDTNSPISLNSVNLNQNAGFQTVTNVNGNVNGSVNGSNPRKTEENTFRVNAPKRLNELITPVLVALKIPLLMQNIESLKDYAYEESALNSKIDGGSMNAVLFENFSQEEANLLQELGQIKTN